MRPFTPRVQTRDTVKLSLVAKSYVTGFRYVFANGEEETVFPDGTVQRITAEGDRTIEFPNGQREVHTANYKKRRYPDGLYELFLYLLVSLSSMLLNPS